MTFAIGDIHGCRTSFETLLKVMQPTTEDLIITLGDYIDRGPDSRGVVDLILQLQKTYRLIALKGNHEIQLERAKQSTQGYDFWLQPLVGGIQTLDSYGGEFSAISSTHWDFFHHTKLFYQSDTHIFVHRGVDPELMMDQQREEVLPWKRFYEASAHVSGKPVICGHTPQPHDMPTNLGHSICIDTCAYGGGWLTGLNVDTGEYWQANEKGQSRRGEI